METEKRSTLENIFDEPVVNATPAGKETSKVEFHAASHVSESPTSSTKKIIKVAKPEHWPDAANYKYTFRMGIPGTKRWYVIPVGGVSLKDHDSISDEYPIPKRKARAASDTSRPDPTEEAAIEVATKLNRIATIEKALGINLKTNDARIALYNSKPEADTLAILEFILANACNFRQIDKESLDAAIVALEQKEQGDLSLDAWLNSGGSLRQSVYIGNNSDNMSDTILEFEMLEITAEVKEQIESGVNEPTPPLRPMRDPVTGQPTRPEPNYEDPGYLKNMARAARRRIVLYMKHCLPFEIPGSTDSEKAEWIARKPAGDIVQINRFISEVMLNYGARADFL